jgi:hypothetical protein
MNRHDGTPRLQLEHPKAASYAHSTSPAGATRAPTPSRLQFLELHLSRCMIKAAAGSFERLERLDTPVKDDYAARMGGLKQTIENEQVALSVSTEVLL